MEMTAEVKRMVRKETGGNPNEPCQGRRGEW